MWGSLRLAHNTPVSQTETGSCQTDNEEDISGKTCQTYMQPSWKVKNIDQAFKLAVTDMTIEASGCGGDSPHCFG